MTSDDCVHHWIIEPSGGTTSSGVCNKCGRHKDFYNSIADMSWCAVGRRKLAQRSGTAFPDEV